VPPWSRPSKGASPKFLASATARFWSHLAAPAASAFAHSPGRRQDPRRRSRGRRRALHPCGALAGGIRPGHGSGINPLVATPADTRFVHLIDAYDPRLRHRLKKPRPEPGSARGKLSIEALIPGCTRGAMREHGQPWRLFRGAHACHGKAAVAAGKTNAPAQPHRS
jgi:hypothetical protein